ncbi:MAG: hypothetical protein ACREOI_30840 [bacterium]
MKYKYAILLGLTSLLLFSNWGCNIGEDVVIEREMTSVRIHGTVSDDATAQPIPSAKVSFKIFHARQTDSAQSNFYPRSSYSNETGMYFYSWSVFGRGTEAIMIKLRIEHLNYTKLDTTAVIQTPRANNELTIDLRLAPLP